MPSPKAIEEAIRREEVRLNAARVVTDWTKIEIYTRRINALQRQLTETRDQIPLFAPAPAQRNYRATLQASDGKCKASLLEAAESGYWFCDSCDMVADINPDNRACLNCGSNRVRYQHASL